MKTRILSFIFIAIAGGMMFSLPSCKKDGTNGRMIVKMTDAPANYLQVNVDVKGISVHTNTDGWMDVPVRAGVYDLLSLQNDLTAVLADSVLLPAGYISQVRLELGTANTIVTTDGAYTLAVPSGSESGLKINIDRELLPDHTMMLLLDFDAAASVVENGQGDFSLKPVIRLKSVIQ